MKPIFKIGDRVTAIGGFGPQYKFLNGTVIHVGGINVDVRLDKGLTVYGGHDSFQYALDPWDIFKDLINK